MWWQTARGRDGFGPFFVTALIGWSGASYLCTGAVHLAVGAVVAGVLAAIGTIWMHLMIRRRDAARIRAIITTPQEFPAIPMPDYLIPYATKQYEIDLAAG
jgi:fructose-specific phosphotransferase system IIC component